MNSSCTRCFFRFDLKHLFGLNSVTMKKNNIMEGIEMTLRAVEQYTLFQSSVLRTQ